MKSSLTCLTILALYYCNDVAAQQVFAYPNQGQSQEQQSRDRYECHTWSVQQTGFDPSNPNASVAVPQSQDPGPQGERIAGAARGAAAGAIIGEIVDDDAGKGAAVGATVGVLKGGAKRRQARRRAAEQQKQQQAAVAGNASSNYNRAFGACMTGRGYTVQ